jgi:hypothetical protein
VTSGLFGTHVRQCEEMTSVPTTRHSRLLFGLEKLNCDRQEI